MLNIRKSLTMASITVMPGQTEEFCEFISQAPSPRLDPRSSHGYAYRRLRNLAPRLLTQIVEFLAASKKLQWLEIDITITTLKIRASVDDIVWASTDEHDLLWEPMAIIAKV